MLCSSWISLSYPFCSPPDFTTLVNVVLRMMLQPGVLIPNLTDPGAKGRGLLSGDLYHSRHSRENGLKDGFSFYLHYPEFSAHPRNFRF